MSLRAFPGSPIPEDTVRVARAAFPKGNRYMQMHDALGAAEAAVSHSVTGTQELV